MALPALVFAGDPVASDPETDLAAAMTREELAFYKEKLRLADAMVAAGDHVPGASPTYVCQLDPCEPATKTLSTRARQQNNAYYCGPASGQVMINFTRGIVDDRTSGETTSNN